MNFPICISTIDLCLQLCWHITLCISSIRGQQDPVVVDDSFTDEIWQFAKIPALRGQLRGTSLRVQNPIGAFSDISAVQS